MFFPATALGTMTSAESPMTADVDEDDDEAFKNALYLSALESSRHRPFKKSHAEVNSPEAELARLRQNNALVLLADTDADTLVVIGVPPQQPDQTDKAYAAIARHFATFHRIHSKNVLSLGSAKFAGLLGPTSQYRTERRLRNEGVFPGGKPRGIQYLLDLRPPRADEDAVVLITELSCSSGILTWFKAQKKYSIPPTMVCGQDDSSLLLDQPDFSRPRKESNASKEITPYAPKPATDFSSFQSPVDSKQKANQDSKPTRIGNWAGVLPTAPVMPDEAADQEPYSHATGNAGIDQETKQENEPNALSAALVQEPRIEPEYSQLRHWSAIERLIHAIEGKDPMLDSAPKLWTFYAIANYFGCAANERISGWITTWLFTAPNHNFIQCNPEVCYRIGLGIQSETLIKDAFSLLVGEKALINVHSENSEVRSSTPKHSVAGRKLELLDDDELNRIDHAANALIRRIQSQYDALIGEDMVWLGRSRAFRSLTTFVANTNTEADVARQLEKHIKDFVRSRVIWVLERDYKTDMGQMEHAPHKVRPFYPHAKAQFWLYNKLRNEERIFTRFFWMALREDRLDLGDNSVSTHPPWRSSYAALAVSQSPGWSKAAGKLENDRPQHKLRMVQSTRLCYWANEFENTLRGRCSLDKANTAGDCWDDNLSAQGACRNDITDVICPATSELRANPRERFLSDNPTTNSALGQLTSPQLSPKRTSGTSHLSDLFNKKRARLEVNGACDNVSQLDGRMFELPIHGTPSKSHETPPPSQEGKTTTVAKLKTMEDPHASRVRFAYVDMVLPIPEEAGSFSSGPDASENVLDEPSGSIKRERRQLPAVADEAGFSVDNLLVEIADAMRWICDELLLATQFFGDGEVPPTDLIDSLLCLTNEEWKYLPLWAGGNDDGTGGVFQDTELPVIETGGFAGGKRGLGHQEPYSESASSDWSNIISTVAKASKEATDGSLTETVSAQSFVDVDMDVRSLNDEPEIQGTETVTDLDALSIRYLARDGQSEVEYDDDRDGEHNLAPTRNMDAEDAEDAEDTEDAGWYDCIV